MLQDYSAFSYLSCICFGQSVTSRATKSVRAASKALVTNCEDDARREVHVVAAAFDFGVTNDVIFK
jgi:hypothetical protein